MIKKPTMIDYYDSIEVSSVNEDYREGFLDGSLPLFIVFDMLNRGHFPNEVKCKVMLIQKAMGMFPDREVADIADEYEQDRGKAHSTHSGYLKKIQNNTKKYRENN